MNILAVDTASKSCSIAIIKDSILLAETTFVLDETHSKHLLVMVHDLFLVAGISPGDVDFYAVTSGPGSFTGLRIGISTVKGLAFASQKPVVTVSTLEALASQFILTDCLICPMLDARRGEVYCARYRASGGVLIQEAGENALPPGEAIAGIEEPCIFIGDGAMVFRDTIEDCLGGLAIFGENTHNYIKASAVAHLAMDKFKNNEMIHASELLPMYIRKSDAQIN